MNWNDISINQYNNIKDLYLDTDLSDEDRLILQINILFGVDALKLKTNELHKYINEMKFLGEKVPKMKIKNEYQLGNNTYTLKKELKDVTVAQWIDWQNFLKDGCLYLDGLILCRSSLRTPSLLLGKRKLIISLHNCRCLHHLSRIFANPTI